MIFKFVSELPPAASPGPRGFKAAILEKLQARPGEWCIYPRPLKHSSLQSTRDRLRKDYGVEAEVRNNQLYIRIAKAP